jgi:replicative DNA helicase
MVPAHKTFWEKVKAGEDPLTVVMSTPDLTKALSWSNEALAFKVSEYASALANRVYLRTSLEYAEQVAALVQDDDVQGVQRLIAQQATMLPAGASNMRTPLEIAMSLNKRIDAGNVSIPWGIASLDGATMGSERGTLTLLAARPSMGKSSLAFQCNEHQALVCLHAGHATR